MLESYIEKKVSDYAKSLNFITFKFSSPSNRGVPDRIFIKEGKIFFIEFKRPKGHLRKLQKYTIQKLINEKVDVYVIDDVEQGKKLIDNFYKKA